MISSTKVSFAGDKLIGGLFGNLNAISDKPNTGDTNTLVIYGAVAIIALIMLIVINVKDSNFNKKNKQEDAENKQEAQEDQGSL